LLSIIIIKFHSNPQQLVHFAITLFINGLSKQRGRAKRVKIKNEIKITEVKTVRIISYNPLQTQKVITLVNFKGLFNSESENAKGTKSLRPKKFKV
jgi:hypothetical protein